MYVDPITRQTYDYTTPIACDNNPKNIIELHPDSDDQDFHILGPEPIKRKPPLMFTPSQIKTTICPNTFTAQDGGIYSKAELDQFWNTSIALFGYPCYILTQCAKYFFTFLFVQATLTLFVKLYKTISIKQNPKQNITLFSSIAHGFFNILTADMANDLSHKNRKYPKLALPTSKSHEYFSDTSNPFSDNQTTPTNNTNCITSPPSFRTKRPYKFRLTRLKLFPKRSPLSQSTINYRTSVLPPAEEQNPPLPNYSTTTFIMTITHINMTI